MAWLFACFQCRKRPKHRTPSVVASNAHCKNQDAFGRDAVFAVRAKPAVLHASPKDLYKVRQTPTCSNRYTEGEAVEFDSRALPFRAQSSNAAKSEPGPAAKNDTEKSNLAGISEPCNKAFSPGKRRPDPRSQVEELEEELENLTTKLTQEADEATKLRDEVRYLRTCGELLESPDEFKKVLDNLEKSSGGQAEGNRRSWLLPSVLAKIELEGASIGAFSAQPDNPIFEGCSDSFSEDSNGKGDSGANNRSTKGNGEVDKPIQNAEVRSPTYVPNKQRPGPDNGKRVHLETFETTEDLLLGLIDGSSLITDSELVTSWENSFGKIDTSKDQSLLEDTAQSRETPPGYEGKEATEGENGLSYMIQKRQKTRTNIASSQCSSGEFYMLQHLPEVNQPEFSAVPQADISTCFSSDTRVFEEDETGNKLNTKQLECELMCPIFETSSSEELSHSTSSERIIEETDFSSGDIEESSKSFFAFRPDSTSESQSLSLASTCDGQAASVEALTEETFSNTGSEMDSLSENTSSSASSAMVPVRCFSPQFKSSRRRCSSTGKGLIETEASSSLDVKKDQRMQLHFTHSILDQHHVDTSEEDHDHYSDALSHMSTQCSDSRNAINGDSERSQSSVLDQTSHSSDTSSSETSPQLGTLQIPSAKDKNVARKNVRLQETTTIAILTQEEKTTQRKKMKQDSSRQENFHVQETESRVAKAMHSESGESHENSFSVWTSDSSISDDSNASIWTSDVSIPNRALQDRDLRGVSDYDYVETSLSEWLKPSSTVQSCQGQDELHMLGTAVEAASKQEQIQSVATTASSPEIQAPLNWMHSPQSPADDRPILGTVAAHWSHISTRKWWDGKGIPNSTNKYKEDQKVHWHATPFEVRLERALAKQGRVFQKKLFGGTMIA